MIESDIIFADRDDRKSIEEGLKFAPKFDENGLIPAVTTDYKTGEVLMQAFMNKEALQRTIEIGEAVYWSRSRQELWYKGATSGLTQKVREIRTDCDQDCIWLRVEMIGGACCHVGYRSCFYRSIPFGNAPTGIITMRFEEGDKAYDPSIVYNKD